MAWSAIGRGENTLVIAPTGSGKTLAAFLWAIDKLAAAGVPDDPQRRCRVLDISPLKALAVDIERNLRSPLTGIRHAATGWPARAGHPGGVRTGDTAADERRKLSAKPPDILITTPESLFLLLTSRARETLRGVQTVILDEVHALAGSKRGAHLALSLERLDALRGSNAAGPAGTRPGSTAGTPSQSPQVRRQLPRPSGSGCQRQCGRRGGGRVPGRLLAGHPLSSRQATSGSSCSWSCRWRIWPIWNGRPGRRER